MRLQVRLEGLDTLSAHTRTMKKGDLSGVRCERAEDLHPLHRMLCYYLKSQGFTIKSGLADLVEALDRELFGRRDAEVSLPNKIRNQTTNLERSLPATVNTSLLLSVT